jgi:hypothetical protein
MIFNKNAAFLLGLVLTMQPILAKDKNFEFNFWTNKETKLDKRVLRIDDHPCGAVAIANISKLPKYSKQSSLIPARVFEINQSGKILKLWSIPVDGTVRAIRGDSLYIDFHKKNYQIKLNGQASMVKNPPNQIIPHLVECVIPFESPNDAACLVHKDVATGKIRILSYETICS